MPFANYAHANDSIAMLSNHESNDYNYNFTSTTPTAVALHNQSQMSPSFTDQPLYTPPTVLDISDDQDCFEGVMDPSWSTLAPSKSNLLSSIPHLNFNSHAPWSRHQIETMNLQNILPDGQEIDPSLLLSSNLPLSVPSSNERRRIVKPPYWTSTTHPVEYNTAIADYINTCGMDLNTSSKADEVARKQNIGHGGGIPTFKTVNMSSFKTVKPQHVNSFTGYRPEYIAPPPPLLLSQDVDGEEEEEEEVDQLTDEVYGTPKIKEEILSDEEEDDGLRSVSPTYEHNHTPSVLQSALYSSPIRESYDLLAEGYDSRWQDHRGEVCDRQYDYAQIAREAEAGRQYYQTIQPSIPDKDLPFNDYQRADTPRPLQQEFQSPPPPSQFSTGRLVPADKINLIDPKTGRARNACKNCHNRKMKCSVDEPSCLNCVKKGLICEYPEYIRRRGKAKKRNRNHHQYLNTASPSTSPSVSPMPTSNMMHMPVPFLNIRMDLATPFASVNKKQRLE